MMAKGEELAVDNPTDKLPTGDENYSGGKVMVIVAWF